jgi:uncharacterized protein with HEPN domain
MTRDTKLYLEDILKAIQEVEEFMGDLSFDDFLKDNKTVKAVTMDFIVIGEAAKYIPLDARRNHPKIPWSKIVGMKNILTHDYPAIKTEVLWKTAKKRLPELKPVIEELLSEK